MMFFCTRIHFERLLRKEFFSARSTAERVMKEHRKIVPLVHLEVVGNATQTDEQLQKAEVI